MADQQTPLRSLTAQAFGLLLAKALGFAFAFALPVLLTRTLSQNEYGLFKQLFLITTTAAALLPLGFGMSAYYYLPREKDPKRRGQVIFNILLFNLLMGSAACLLLILWPGVIAAIFRDPGISSYVPLLGVIILLWLSSSFVETVAVANQELKLATIFIVAGQLTRTILLLACAIMFDSVRALLYAAMIHGVLQNAALIWMACFKTQR
jgi:O-antigen/teichoic acid export membrane protein